MARAPRRARTPSSSSESSCAPPQQQQQEEAQSPYANSPTVRVNLHLPYDATPARGHRFSTLRVVADPSRPPSHSVPDPSTSSAEGLAGRRNSQDSKKEKANRERAERALRRRSDRSEAPSPPEESPWRTRRKELRAAKMAARLAAQQKEKEKEEVKKDEDKDAGENNEADGSGAIGSSGSAFKRARSTADVETGGGPAADQDVVGIDAALRTPAPKRAKRGAGKAETVSATTAPDRALEGATSESAAANPFDATSDAETVSNASDDGGEGDGQAHKAADRRRSLVLLNAATRQESSLETSQFSTNDHLPGSNSSDTGGEDVGQDNRTIAHRNGHNNRHRDPRPAVLGTISTRRFAAFEEEIPHTTTTTTAASSPRPPPTPPLQLNQSDFPDELDAIAADTTPPIPRQHKFVHEVLGPASQQELLSSSSSSPFASVQNRRPPIYHMFEPTTGRFLVQQKGEDKMHIKKQVKEKEILYEGRGQRRVSDGAQGLEFGKPPTPRKTKRRSRIVTMPLPLVVKKNYGGDQGDGQQK